MQNAWTERERLRLPGISGGYVTVFLRRLDRQTWQWAWYASLPGWGRVGRECAAEVAAPMRHLAIDGALLELRRRWEHVPAVAVAVEALLDRWG